jgi:hypothetical protein
MTFQRISKVSSSPAYSTSAIQAWRKVPEQRSEEALHGNAAKAPLEFKHDFADIAIDRRSSREAMARPGTTGGPTGLPDRLKTSIERLSGVSMSDVRVHQNSCAPARLHAHAFTCGTDIHLAQGQEQHLAHEAWHAVQQKQGRARPDSARTLDPSINDDPGLEREADRMGAHASRADFSRAWKNPLPVSQPPQPKVIQPKKIGTDFGAFETTRFAELNDRGVEIILKFHPDETKVDARKIALVQSVKAVKASGDAYAVDPTRANRMVPRGKPGAGYVIDASGATNNPIFYDTKNLAPAEELKDTPQSANKSADPTELGVNTQFELGFCFKENTGDAAKKKQSAGLFDRPQGLKKVGAGMTFETTALAIEGADKNKYYGSVKWGYKIGGTARAPAVTKMDIERASKATPTANFIGPAKLWNIGKTQGTLKVIADPATVTKSDLRTTETLAKDTKLKQLDTIAGGAEPMIKAEVLNPDGTGSGRVIYINVPDVKDAGDGSANKQLPVR